MQYKKSQITLFLLLIIGLGIVALFYLPNSPFKLTVLNEINFAGFTWQVGGNGNVNIVNEQVKMSNSISGGGNTQGNTYFAGISTDVTGMDEILVIAEADGYASAYRASASSGIQISIEGSQGGTVSTGTWISASSSGSESAQTKSEHIDARVYKLRNNFDGTWSVLESLGVGDVFIVKSTQTISGSPILSIRAYVNHGVVSNDAGASASITATVYNVVVKENAFAVCKADEFWQDKNADGKPTIDECFDLQTIVLNSEEAIKESFDEKIIRLTAELEAKNAGLTADIDLLKQQLQSQQQAGYDDTILKQQIAELQAELKEAKSTLNSIQAGDKNVVAVIEGEEKFKEPNFIKQFFNKIIAFFRNLFS